MFFFSLSHRVLILGMLLCNLLGTFLEKISKSCRSQFELENSVVSAGDQWLGKDHFEAFSMLGTGEDEAALSQLIWSRFKRKVLALQVSKLHGILSCVRNLDVLFASTP